MKKRFSDEQVISILREAEAGVSARELAVSTPFRTPPFAPGIRSMAEPEVKRLTCVDAGRMPGGHTTGF